MSLAIRKGIYSDSLDINPRASPADDTPENVMIVRTLILNVKSESVPIECERFGDIPYDECRHDARNFYFSHVVARLPKLRRQQERLD